MLTKSDLQQIRNIVKEEAKKAVIGESPQIVEKIVARELAPIKKDIQTIKTDITKIKKDIDVIISFFDNEYLGLRRRVERIEDHLGFSPLQPYL